MLNAWAPGHCLLIYIFYQIPTPILNPLSTGRLFHCYMLDESICHFRGVGSILSV